MVKGEISVINPLDKWNWNKSLPEPTVQNTQWAVKTKIHSWPFENLSVSSFLISFCERKKLYLEFKEQSRCAAEPQ